MRPQAAWRAWRRRRALARRWGSHHTPQGLAPLAGQPALRADLGKQLGVAPRAARVVGAQHAGRRGRAAVGGHFGGAILIVVGAQLSASCDDRMRGGAGAGSCGWALPGAAAASSRRASAQPAARLQVRTRPTAQAGRTMFRMIRTSSSSGYSSRLVDSLHGSRLGNVARGNSPRGNVRTHGEPSCGGGVHTRMAGSARSVLRGRRGTRGRGPCMAGAPVGGVGRAVGGRGQHNSEVGAGGVVGLQHCHRWRRRGARAVSGSAWRLWRCSAGRAAARATLQSQQASHPGPPTRIVQAGVGG